ncbi:MAG TPA: trypsin-like serine protease [Pseudonocardiaceae bacterium]|nr:trypsin-like serine protease [Pseudonocardiaceae bacterium]
MIRTGIGAAVLATALLVAAALPAQASETNAAHRVSAADQAATSAYWTPRRMAAATALDSSTADQPQDAPPGTPTGTLFDGVPTVGALFSTTGGKAHFCTASVVLSPTRDLLLTAAHCVYGTNGYQSNVAFVPGYHDGVAPYGTWPVSSLLVAQGWQTSRDQNLDFAFLTVAADADGRQIQDVTGGNLLGIDRGYDHTVTVIGYSDTADNPTDQPIECRTKSFQAMPSQLQFNCHGYFDGTSGGPWLTGFDPDTGSGTVIGDIGGYEEGGDYEYTSYSPYFGRPTLELYLQAEFDQVHSG